MSLGIHFPILLRQTNRQYLVWWTVSVTQEACRTETVPVDLRCSVTVVWTQCTFPTLPIVFFLFYDFNIIYFFTNRTCVRNKLQHFSISLCIILRGRWCDIIVLNVHAPTEDKCKDTKDSFQEEVERLFNQFSMYHTKILLQKFHCNGGEKKIFSYDNWQLTTRKYRNR
jgi:hypothetical protein